MLVYPRDPSGPLKSVNTTPHCLYATTNPVTIMLRYVLRTIYKHTLSPANPDEPDLHFYNETFDCFDALSLAHSATFDIRKIVIIYFSVILLE